MEARINSTEQECRTILRTCRELFAKKLHDYGEVWRNMRVTSMTDLILSKIHRTKQIEDLQGETFVSEGVEANYMDMVNYAIFCLIKLTLPAA